MDKKTHEYLRKIARKGGLKSRRELTREQAQDMVKVREAKRKAKQDDIDSE